MKGLNKVLLVAAVAAPFAAQAELKSIDDAMMSDVSGQSGLVIEAGFGTGPASVFAAFTVLGRTQVSLSLHSNGKLTLKHGTTASNDVIGNVPAAGPGTKPSVVSLLRTSDRWCG